jgi:hypothetical protein
MDWQTTITGLLVAGAAAYVARAAWRAWLGSKAGCGGGCSCPTPGKPLGAGKEPAAFVPAEQLTLRRRA